MLLTRPFFILYALVFSLSSVQAEDRIYDIEVLAFSHAKGKYFSVEEWNENWATPTLTELVDLTNQDASTGFVAEETALPGMDDIIKRIETSSRYRLLTFKRWQQPGLDRKSAIPVRVHSNTIYEYEETEAESSDFISSDDTTHLDQIGKQHATDLRSSINSVSTREDDHKELEKTVTLVQAPELDGSIKIELGRFLHIYTDLTYVAPTEEHVELVPYSVPSDGNTAQEEKYLELKTTKLANLNNIKTSPLNIADQTNNIEPNVISLNNQYSVQGFELKAHLKTRSKEFQYIDHPLFGLIIRITPVES